jgi:excisionase family DNA binding protein
MLTPREVAAIFGVRTTTLARLCQRGEISCERTLGGHRRYHRADINALMQKRSINPDRVAMEQDAVRLYLQGWSIHQVSKRFDCNYDTMRRILVRHSVIRVKEVER